MQTIQHPEPVAHLAGLQQPRDTGIGVLGDLPWGAHICMFYETKEDLLDSCVSYFDAGLKRNEFCVWVVSDPVKQQDAIAGLEQRIPGLSGYLDKNQIEILDGKDWYLKNDACDLQRISEAWAEKYHHSLAMGYEGLRVSGDAVWVRSKYWNEFIEYEHEIDHALADKQMLVLCTYRLAASTAADVLDVADAHRCSIARRNGRWEFLETPAPGQAKRRTEPPSDTVDILSRPFPGHRDLTARERIVLAHVIMGGSSKEIARMLHITHRTVEFHRANIMKKLGARNTADLLWMVLGK